MTYYNVGKIVNTQGLQGELRVLSVTDFADERFKKKSVLALFDIKVLMLTVTRNLNIHDVIIFVIKKS